MTLTETIKRRLGDPLLSYEERIALKCQVAADLEHRGQYETAREILAELWHGVGQQPTVEGLSEVTAAEVILRVGSLSSWFGSAAQNKEIQATAKDLISESISRFRKLGKSIKAAAAQSDLALCYWREGAYDDARACLESALDAFTDADNVQKAKTLLRLVSVEYSSGRPNEALRILKSNADIFDLNHALQGRFRNMLAGVLTLLGKAEHRRDYIDQAIIEYTEASSNFERAGHTSYRARAENNLGFLLSTVGKFDEAYQRIGLARRLFVDLKDGGGVAQVDETRAQVLLAEGRVKEAERAVNNAVRVLEKGGENGTLAEALTTQGAVWARLGRVEESQGLLRRAAEVGEQAGSSEESGKALLTLLEEHAGWLPGRELWEVYGRADGLLGKTQDAEIVRRLRACARRVMEVLAGESERDGDSWEGGSFYQDVLAYEARLIGRALRDGQGSVTRAARLLGFRHHGSLVALLRARHKGLMPMRTPPSPRRRGVVREGARRPRRGEKARPPVTILFVEDSDVVADAVKSSLESLGWRVEICADGADAWRRVKGRERYDLLIVDNDLSGLTGVELVRRARRLPHRRRTPVIVLSAGDAEKEAWRAGADAFLRKPEDVAWLSATVARLLPGGETEETGGNSAARGERS